MRTDNISDFFAQTYAQRRAKFILGVAQIGGVTANSEHPVAFGPRYGSLRIDVACFGRERTGETRFFYFPEWTAATRMRVRPSRSR
jgi:hypothetical protein